MNVDAFYNLSMAVYAWLESANCTSTDPEIFFSEESNTVKSARKICEECPVKTECLNDAIEKDDQFGIRGGLTARERKNLRRRLRFSRPRMLSESTIE
jgi:WhiB family redox-sensing transcriptional regulator